MKKVLFVAIMSFFVGTLNAVRIPMYVHTVSFDSHGGQVRHLPSRNRILPIVEIEENVISVSIPHEGLECMLTLLGSDGEVIYSAYFVSASTSSFYVSSLGEASTVIVTINGISYFGEF